MKHFLLIPLMAAWLQPASVADKIVAYSKQQMGKKVGHGECWDLAQAALDAAGASWKAPFDFGDKIDYKKTDLQPADIMQFSNVSFSFPHGTMSFPQHTAIVYKANKHMVTVFQQNFNKKRYVDTLTINLDQMKKGRLEVYRPKAL